jgi:uncharacterized protein YgiB involved in biofilm formation
MSDDQSEDRGLNIATRVLGGLLVAGVVAIGVAMIFHRGPDGALVLATSSDCLRVFDQNTCGAIVSKALKIHGQSAPRFATASLCELNFGEGRCKPSVDDAAPLSFYVPEIAAILATRDDRKVVTAIVPVYAGKDQRGAPDGSTAIYYHGNAVGTLQSKRFGGAEISIALDPSGQSLTGETVRALARN